MNTQKIEALLAEKYRYRPLPPDLSEKYRAFFRENIPDWMSVGGEERPLYTANGTRVCDSYDRIVIGDYGAFVEFSREPDGISFTIQPGQEYRISDPKYSRGVKYIWLTVPDGSGIKIYKQKRRVSYADYIPGRYYISVREAFPETGKEPQL